MISPVTNVQLLCKINFIIPQKMTLQETTTVLIIRDSDPLCVETNILTENSSVFKFILEECQFEEHDLSDFTAEAVSLFLTLLRDMEMVDIEDRQFREINKLTNAFKVEWLKRDCQRWIGRRILDVSSIEDKMFLFNECYYALKRLENEEYMNMFVEEFGSSKDITFISRHLSDFDNLETNMIYPLMQLAGSNSKVILETLSQSVANNPGLSRNAMLVQDTRYKARSLPQWDGLRCLSPFR